MRSRREKIDLKRGGYIRIPHHAYPKWGEYFENIPQRCDRCWEATGQFTSRKGSGRWLCRKCNFKALNSSAPSGTDVLKMKLTLRLKRLLWNFTHKNKIPNQPGHRDS